MSETDSIPNSLPCVEGIVFRHVADFPCYAVGSDGSIWSCKKLKGRGRGIGVTSVVGPWKKLLPHKGKVYLFVSLTKHGKVFSRLVHRLVATAFYGPCPVGMECCHNNGNPLDCRSENLRWDTRQSNADDRVIHGTLVEGVRHHNAKLTDDDVRKIRSEYVKGSKTHGTYALAERFGVNQQVIWVVVTGKSWAHVK